MDVLKKNRTAVFPALLMITVMQCAVEAPLSTDESALSVSIVAAKTVTQPLP